MPRASTPDTARLALSLTGVIAVLVLLEQTPELLRPLEPVNLGLAQATELLLQYLDVPVARLGTILMHPDGFSYRITYVCSVDSLHPVIDHWRHHCRSSSTASDRAGRRVPVVSEG